MKYIGNAPSAALLFLTLFGATFSVACANRGAPDVLFPTPATLPTPTLYVDAEPSPVASLTPVAPDSGWLQLRPGLEQRAINVTSEDGTWQENVTILRLAPSRFNFDVLYRPGEPQSLPAWQEQSGALLIVNGGFFTEENYATGLVISGGQSYGSSYDGFGGMFAVTESGPALRWLPQQPYNPDESLLAALQSFPMLLTPGGVPGPGDDDGQRARRTIVAQDGEGRILFLIAGIGHFTLFELSRYLTGSDLDLDAALNLDGGASSGLLLMDPPLLIPAFELLPTVIAVYEK